MHATQILAVFESIPDLVGRTSVSDWLSEHGCWEAKWQGGRLVLQIGEDAVDDEEEDGGPMRLPELMITLTHEAPDQDAVRLRINIREDIDGVEHASLWPSLGVFYQTLLLWLPVGVDLPDDDHDALPEYEEGRRGRRADQLAPEVRFWDPQVSWQLTGWRGEITSLRVAWSASTTELTHCLAGLVQLRTPHSPSTYRQDDGTWADHPPQQTLPCLWVHTLRELIQLWELLPARAPRLVLISHDVFSPRLAATLADYYGFRHSGWKGVYLLTRRSLTKGAHSAI